MSDDPEGSGGQRPDLQREILRRLAAAGGAGGTTTDITTWIAGPGTVEITTWRPGPAVAITTWLPGPGRHPTLTTVADAEGALKPGKYRIETRHVTEFDVLESGHVVLRRDETHGGEPESRE